MSMTGSYPKAEILTGPERRRRWSVAENLEMVAQTREAGVTVSLVARRCGISPNQLFTWRRLAEQGALTATAAEEEVVPASAFRAQQEQIRELQRLLDKKTLEVEILQEALSVAEDKKRACGHCRCPRVFCHERRLHRAGRGPFASRRAGGAADGRALSPAQRPSAPAGRIAPGRDRGGHRRHADLRLCPHLGPVAPQSLGRGPFARQSQTGLSGDEGSWPSARPSCWRGRAPSRRPHQRRSIQPALVLRWLRDRLRQWRKGPGRLRARLLRPGSHGPCRHHRGPQG